MQLTTTIEIDVPDDVVNKIAHYLITGAVEGGTGYWAYSEKYRWGDEMIGHSHEQANGSRDWQPGDTEYATVTIESVEDPVDFEPVDVDVPKMVATIQRLLSDPTVKPFYNDGYDKTFKVRLIETFEQVRRGVSLDRTDFDHDASDSDCMMQLCVLGEIVYG